VRRMIATPGEPDLPVPVLESFHEQTNEELTENDIKRMDADDQAIQTILLGLPKDVYAVVDSCETAKEIQKRVQQMMKENIAANLKFLNNLQPEWKRHVTIVRQTKNLHEADFTQIYDFLKMNQDEVNELRAERLAKTHDPLALMAHSQNSYKFPTTHNDQSSPSTHSQQSFPINNKYNPQPSLNQNFMQPPMTSLEDINDPTEAINDALILFAKAFQLTAPTKNKQRTSSNPHNHQIAQPGMNMSQDRQIQNARGNGGNHFGQHAGQNGLVVVPGIANQNRTGNVVAARAEGDLDEIEEVNANCILMVNLLHASSSGTHLDKAPVYDTCGSAEEEQYMDLLKPIPKPQLVTQNDNHVNSVAPSMVQSGGTVETSYALNEETRAHQETVYRNLIDQVAHVNMVNYNMRATNAELKSELARYKIQEQRIEISQEKYDKLEKCYQKSIYQEQYLTRKINALHLSSAKQITTLNDEISNLNKQLSKEKSIISSFTEENKKLKHDFKTQEDRFLDKEVILKAKIKDLKNILLKRDQTVQTMHMLNPKPNSFYHPDQKMALGYLNPSYLKKAQLKQQSLYNANRAHAKLHNLIYENDKLRVQLFENTSESINNTSGTSVTPHVDKPKLITANPHSKKSYASIPSHSVPQPREFNVAKHRKCDSATVNTSSTGLVYTAKTRRPQPKGNTRNARVPSASKSSEVKKNVTVEDHRRILLLSNNQKTMPSECNNTKLAIRNDKSKIIYGTCKQCLVTANHDACLLFPVNALNSHANNLCANVSLSVNQKRHRIQGKSKRASHPPKLVPNSKQRLHLDLCGPMRVIKDEMPEVIKNFLKKIYVRLQAPVIIQNGVVERKNRTLVEVARTMLIFSHAPLFLWALRVTLKIVPLFTDVSTRHHTSLFKAENQTSFTFIGALCYPKNDREDISKLGAKGDIGFFIGYSANFVAYRVYNRRT
nr:hypothetical protein [Tanacetum cinerariifolium]